MYALAEENSIVALDATTGKQVWSHETDPKIPVCLIPPGTEFAGHSRLP
jgi:outer membrane protein assembly factor BamB